jgi:phospholipase C
MADKANTEESATSSKGSTESCDAVMPHIETVVMLMLENRSLDTMLSFLYPEDTKPNAVYPRGSCPNFNGATLNTSNAYHDKTYFVTNGTTKSPLGGSALEVPNMDPYETFEHVGYQMYADARGNMPTGYFWCDKPTMQGFAWDYNGFLTDNQAVMGSYSAEQLPALYGLAKNYAISDRWFSSVPSETDPNRAYSVCGTSRGAVNNSELDGSTFADSKTLFNALGDAGKSWGIYWQSKGIASGAPIWDVYTPYFFPQINNAPNGAIEHFDDPGNPRAFMQALEAGTLPNFCYLEPQWGGGPTNVLKIQGNDYHPSASVGPGEYALNQLYEALINSKQWPNMLFIVTFDEHGGTFDHEPPTKTVSPDGIVGKSKFKFDRLGVRVPTLLISPYIEEGVVFRSAVEDVDFDHTSFISTLLRWAGVDPATAGLGDRVAAAPTFDGVLGTVARANAPTFEVPASYAETSIFSDALVSSPLDENEDPIPTKSMNIRDFREACDASQNDPEGFEKRLRKLMYGV